MIRNAAYLPMLGYVARAVVVATKIGRRNVFHVWTESDRGERRQLSYPWATADDAQQHADSINRDVLREERKAMRRHNPSADDIAKAVAALAPQACQGCGKDLGAERFLGPVCGACVRRRHAADTGRKAPRKGKRNPGAEVTQAARDGWRGVNRPPYASSANGLAWSVGASLRALGHPEPKKASMSRGYSVRVDGKVYSAPTEYEANGGAGRGARASGSKKRAARTTAGDALARVVNYGGEEITVAKLYELLPRELADRWLMGYDAGLAAREAREDNPGDDPAELEAACDAFEKFHGFKPTKAHRVNLPKIGKHLVALGKAISVSYDSAKWTHRKKGYIHDFTSAPHVATNPARNVLIIFGGKLRVEPEGITG